MSEVGAGATGRGIATLGNGQYRVVQVEVVSEVLLDEPVLDPVAADLRVACGIPGNPGGDAVHDDITGLPACGRADLGEPGSSPGERRGFGDAGDTQAKTKEAKQGFYGIEWGKQWVKSPSLTTGQCPVMKYNRGLMEAILWGRMDYLGAVVNTEIIPLEKAVEAYHIFDEGSPKKFVIDPHGSVRR